MENKKSFQYVDPDVTKIKFEKELKEFMGLKDEYRKKGVICIDVTPPTICLIFAAPHINPVPIAFAVKIDFTNWDVEPPSIFFINPFTGNNINGNEVKIQFIQKNETPIPGQFSLQDLLQARDTDKPFFCIPGVKEYHQHPAHSGDNWLLYRNKGEGKLITLIDQLYSHSIVHANGYNIHLNFSIVGISSDVNKI